eukprot:gene1773-542_t
MDEKKIKKIFDELDLDKTGRISRSEFKEFMIKEIKHSTLADFEKKSNTLFNSADLNHNNFIEFEEFYNIMLNAKLVKDQFNKHDVYENWEKFSLKPQVHPLIYQKNDDKAYQIMLSNITGTLITRTCMSPLERIKILNQVETFLGKEMNKNIPNYSKSISHAVKVIIEKEGYRGLFKGNFTNILRVFPQVCTRFYTFYVTNRFVKKNITQNNLASSLISGSVSSIAALVSTYPLEVLRTRLAVQIDPENQKYKSLKDAIHKIRFNTSLSGILCHTTFNFTIYEICQLLFERFQQYPLNIYEKIFCGIFSGTMSLLITHPFDLIRRRLMIQGMYKKENYYKNGIDALKNIIQREGVFGLYSGLNPSLAKVIPSLTISFLIYEISKIFVGAI